MPLNEILLVSPVVTWSSYVSYCLTGWKCKISRSGIYVFTVQ
jgi:hypothetical protein